MENNTVAWIIVLASLVLTALGTVMIRNLLKAAIMLALTSAILTIALFIMGAQLAAVMELSVCAGLVTAVFVSAISLTKTSSAEEREIKNRERLRRFLPLPLILVLLAIGVFLLWPGMPITLAPGAGAGAAARQIIWDKRALDVLGQILIILSGVLGVAVLFKGREVK